MSPAFFVLTGSGLALALAASLLAAWRRLTFEARLLAAGLLAVSLAMPAIVLQNSGSPVSGWLVLELLDTGLGLAVGPLLALAVRRLTRPEAPWGRLDLLHLAPAAAVTAATLLRQAPVFPIELVVAHQVTYTLASAIRLRRTPAGRSRVWPWRFLGLAGVVHLAQGCRMLFSHEPHLADVVPLTATAGLLTLVLLALRERLLGIERPGQAEPARKYARSILPPDTAADLQEKLRRALDEDRAWAAPDLTLAALAERIGCSPHQLSQLLNESLSQSFPDLVTGYRLDEARRLLLDPGHDVYTIDAVAARSGFSSRSTFYAAFRKRFGTSPTDFRRAARSA